MKFCVVSTGWNCADWARQALGSIYAQTVDDYRVMIVDDHSSDRTATIAKEWCERHGTGRWRLTVNPSRYGSVRSQYEAILALDPADDDVIVWVDLDGDRLASPYALERVAEAYARGALLTYGSYLPFPDMGTSPPALPYPDEVVSSNRYRDYTRSSGTRFNHLRTMSGRIFRAIPPEQLQWVRGPRTGEFYTHGADYLFMLAGLELAGGKYECLPDPLLIYNHANPRADNLAHNDETTRCVVDFLQRTPLEPRRRWAGGTTPAARPPATPATPSREIREQLTLPRPRRPEDTDLYLPADERRQLLREYGRAYGLRVFIETGTNDGGTPMFLKDDFDRLHTIELGEGPYQRAVRLFREYPQVTCWHGDSTDVLPKVLAEIVRPALVWLDGHHSGPGTARGPLTTPVVAELETLFADGRAHVILVDDIRCFGGGDEHDLEPHYADFPSIGWIRETAASYGYDCVIVDDIARLTPRS